MDIRPGEFISSDAGLLVDTTLTIPCLDTVSCLPYSMGYFHFIPFQVVVWIAGTGVSWET